MDGYIKLFRKMVDWEHYADLTTFKLFLHLLLTANFRDKKYKGFLVSRGSVAIEESKLGDRCGLTYQEVRTAINKLIKSGEVAKKSTNKFCILTIVNFEEYQCIEQQDNEQLTSNQRTINELLTSVEEERKECKNKYNVHFETIWAMYFNKRGKGQVSKTQKERLCKIPVEEWERIIARYRQDLEKTPWKKPQNGSTFFNSGYVDYTDANYSQSKPHKAWEGVPRL